MKGVKIVSRPYSFGGDSSLVMEVRLGEYHLTVYKCGHIIISGVPGCYESIGELYEYLASVATPKHPEKVLTNI